MSRARLDHPTPCSSGAIIFAIGNLALLAGLVLGNGGAVGLGIALLLVPLTIYLRLRRSMQGLDLSQESAEAAFEGDRLRVSIVLRNHGRRGVDHPRFSEVFGPEDDAQKDLVFPQRIAPDDTTQASYEAICLGPRGRYRFGPTVLRLSDLFGWFEIQTALENDRRITVYPRLDDFGLLAAMSALGSSGPGEQIRGGPGVSGEFWSVREYRPGDPRRRIHWAATARHGSLIVREFGRPASGDIAVVLDRNQQVPGAQRRFGAFENTVRLAAGIVDHALTHGRAVQVLDATGRLGPPPGSPGSARVDWLEPLVDVMPDTEVALSEALTARREELAQSALIIVTVHAYLYENEALEAALSRFVHEGRRVVAVLVDDDRDANAERRRLARHRLRRRGIEAHVLGRTRYGRSPREEVA